MHPQRLFLTFCAMYMAVSAFPIWGEPVATEDADETAVWNYPPPDPSGTPTARRMIHLE